MGIEPTSSAWKAEVLPLNYTRLREQFPSSARNQRIWWWGKDSNLRRQCQQIYSLPPLAAREPHRVKQVAHTRQTATRCQAWCRQWDSNSRPTAYKAVALPTVLCRQRRRILCHPSRGGKWISRPAPSRLSLPTRGLAAAHGPAPALPQGWRHPPRSNTGSHSPPPPQ